MADKGREVLDGWMFSTDAMRNCALHVNDARLNDEKVSVRQVREILRWFGASVGEAEPNGEAV